MKYLGLINLGIYGRAYQVMSLPYILGKALDTVMFPYFSLNANTQESNGNKYLISYFSVLLCSISAVIYYLSGEITVYCFLLNGLMLLDHSVAGNFNIS